MQDYLYFIYTIEAHADAEGEYVGPFATEEERDAEACRLRVNSKALVSTARTCVYRANIEKELAGQLNTPSIVAA
ncbi:MAG: hypothetical protein K0U93_11895 [Gammaproteobacteria bacterium]|nr:hypothetical protein [Gammaproteobacteria bacterium]